MVIGGGEPAEILFRIAPLVLAAWLDEIHAVVDVPVDQLAIPHRNTDLALGLPFVHLLDADDAEEAAVVEFAGIAARHVQKMHEHDRADRQAESQGPAEVQAGDDQRDAEGQEALHAHGFLAAAALEHGGERRDHAGQHERQCQRQQHHAGRQDEVEAENHLRGRAGLGDRRLRALALAARPGRRRFGGGLEQTGDQIVRPARLFHPRTQQAGGEDGDAQLPQAADRYHGREQRVEHAAEHAADRHPQIEFGQVPRARPILGQFAVADQRRGEEADHVKDN